MEGVIGSRSTGVGVRDGKWRADVTGDPECRRSGSILARPEPRRLRVPLSRHGLTG